MDRNVCSSAHGVLIDKNEVISEWVITQVEKEGSTGWARVYGCWRPPQQNTIENKEALTTECYELHNFYDIQGTRYWILFQPITSSSTTVATFLTKFLEHSLNSFNLPITLSTRNLYIIIYLFAVENISEIIYFNLSFSFNGVSSEIRKNWRVILILIYFKAFQYFKLFKNNYWNAFKYFDFLERQFWLFFQNCVHQN